MIVPITITTASVQTGGTNDVSTTCKHMAKATSEAIGVNYNMVENQDGIERYYIPTDSIGYPGIYIVFEVKIGSSPDWNYIACGIFDNALQNFSYDTEDTNIFVSHNGSETENTLPGIPETCVMMFDENKDTILFDVHPGRTLNGTDAYDMLSSRRSKISFTFFLAKDSKEGILCGVGASHILSLKTRTARMVGDTSSTGSVSQKLISSANFLHLTKMVNYLDPSYPEMKSAYVSVSRPFEAIENKIYVSSLYSGEKRWGRAGQIDSWPETYGTRDHPGNPCFFPIEPFVNY